MLTGEGNLGKSGVLRALRAVLLNEFHQDRIRANAKESVLRLTFAGDSHDVGRIERRKSARTNSYEITMRNGEVRPFPMAGKKTPLELEQIGFSQIRCGKDDKHDLTFHRQFDDPLFLLQEDRATVACFIHKVFRLDRDEDALRRMIADSQETLKAFDARAKQIAKVELALAKAKTTLDDTVSRRAVLREAVTKAEAADAQVERLRLAVERLRKAAELRVEADRLLDLADTYDRSLAVLGRLREALLRLSHLRSLHLRWAEALAARDEAQAARDALAAALPPLSALSAAVARRVRIGRQVDALASALQARDAAAARHAALGKALPAMERLRSSLASVSRARRQLSGWREAREGAERAAARAEAARATATALERFAAAFRNFDRLRRQRHAWREALDHATRAGAAVAVLREAEAKLGGFRGAMDRRGRLLAHAASWRTAEAARSASMQRLDQLRAVAGELVRKDQQLRAWLGRCPTCNGQFGPEHKHEEAHAA